MISNVKLPSGWDIEAFGMKSFGYGAKETVSQLYLSIYRRGTTSLMSKGKLAEEMLAPSLLAR